MIPDWLLFALVVVGPILWLAASFGADAVRSWLYWHRVDRAWRQADVRRARVADALARRRR